MRTVMGINPIRHPPCARSSVRGNIGPESGLREGLKQRAEPGGEGRLGQSAKSA